MNGPLRRKPPRWLLILVLITLGAVHPGFAAPGLSSSNFGPADALAEKTRPTQNIGIEGRTTAVLPGPDYRPRPLDDRTELILRIESVTPVSGSNYSYNFHYIVFEPGPYDLANYLVLPDGSVPQVHEIPVVVRALLPEDHNGQLQPFAPRLFPWIGGYRVALGFMGLLWAGGIAAFVMAGRKKPAPTPAPLPAPPSLAERLRPLVEAAAAGRLSTEGQAQLERLLTAYWREKLGLPELRMAEAVTRLKNHDQAGALLRALERWLHRPDGASAAEINAVLEPYGHPATPVRTSAIAANGVEARSP